MIFQPTGKKVVEWYVEATNSFTYYGKMSFWKGTMPSKEDLLAHDPVNLTNNQSMSSLRSALLALGCKEVHRATTQKIQIGYDKDKTGVTIPFADYQLTEANLLEDTADFVLIFTSNRTDWFHPLEAAVLVFMGTVGEYGSSVDLELTSTQFKSDTKVRVGNFKFEFN